MERLEQRFKSLEKDILDPKSVLHVDGLLVREKRTRPLSRDYNRERGGRRVVS